MRHDAVVLFSGALEVVQRRSRISGAVVVDAEDSPGIVLAAGERRPIKNGPVKRHRVMARIVAVGAEAGELVIDSVSERVGIDMEDDAVAVALASGSRGASEQETIGEGQRSFRVGAVEVVAAGAA